MDEPDKTPLQKAVESLDFPTIEKLINSGENVNQKYPNGDTLLHVLARKMMDKREENITGVKMVLELLLKSEPETDVRNADGSTPLHIAAESDCVQGITLLAKGGADVKAKNNDGENSLNLACRIGKLHTLCVLIHMGAEVNNASTVDGTTPLHRACARTYVDAVRYLTRRGADVNARNSAGRTPLMMALRASKASTQANVIYTVSHLLNKGADVNGLDNAGNNVLSHALTKESQKIILRTLAKMDALNKTVSRSLLGTISENNYSRCYFESCKKELSLAKSSKILDCSITCFDLLVVSQKKLMTWVKDKYFIDGFEGNAAEIIFPKYGRAMKRRVEKAEVRRNLYDAAGNSLRKCLPFPVPPSQVVIDKILDYLEKRDWLLLVTT